MALRDGRILIFCGGSLIVMFDALMQQRMYVDLNLDDKNINHLLPLRDGRLAVCRSNHLEIWNLGCYIRSGDAMSLHVYSSVAYFAEIGTGLVLLMRTVLLEC